MTELTENDRDNYFSYTEPGSFEIASSQCSFCLYNKPENETACVKYPDFKPLIVLENKTRCSFIKFKKEREIF